MNKTLIISVLVVVVMFSLKCSSWPEIGQQAKDDDDCRKQYGESTCAEIGSYTCAKLDDQYIINETMCDFCKTYGNSEAIVYHTGQERTCKELAGGDYLQVDPECDWIYKNADTETGSLGHCLAVHNKSMYYCVEFGSKHAVSFHKYVPAETKCQMCSEFGRDGDNYAKVSDIGVPGCNTFFLNFWPDFH